MQLTSVQEICQAIADGIEVQFRHHQVITTASPSKWFDVNSNKVFWIAIGDGIEWRTKPKIIKYRLGLVNQGAISPVYNILSAWNYADEERIAKYHNFVKWISDWQEVEVE